MILTWGNRPVGFAKDALTKNRFLDGKLQIWQPRNGYRAGSDPVFLAAAVGAEPGQSVLELGCGAAVASLCLGQRVRGLQLTGVELQPDYADLARINAGENGIKLSVVTADLRDLPDALRDQNFDHVFANPPYFRPAHRTNAADAGRETALAGGTPLICWIDIATRRLKPGGHLTLIQKADRLPDVLVAMDGRLGGIRVKPLVPRTGRSAELVIVTARKGARSPFILLSPLVLHEGKQHQGDGESYSRIAQAVLRRGDALEIL